MGRCTSDNPPQSKRAKTVNRPQQSRRQGGLSLALSASLLSSSSSSLFLSSFYSSSLFYIFLCSTFFSFSGQYCTLVSTHTHTHTHTHTYIYIYIYICVYVCTTANTTAIVDVWPRPIKSRPSKGNCQIFSTFVCGCPSLLTFIFICIVSGRWPTPPPPPTTHQPPFKTLPLFLVANSSIDHESNIPSRFNIFMG